MGHHLVLCTHKVAFYNCNKVGSEYSILFGPYGSGIAHGLTGLQVADNIVVRDHLFEKEGQHHVHSQGQTLRSCHHHHCDPNDEEVKQFREVPGAVPEAPDDSKLNYDKFEQEGKEANHCGHRANKVYHYG